VGAKQCLILGNISGATKLIDATCATKTQDRGRRVFLKIFKKRWGAILKNDVF
jgi:hypothetical protein